MEINKLIHVGDSRETIERVLKSKGIRFSYDEFQQRYQSNIKGNNCLFDKSILLFVYLDKSGRMSRIETQEAYTMP